MNDGLWITLVLAGPFCVLCLAAVLLERPWVKKRYRCWTCGTVIHRRIAPNRRHMRWQPALEPDGYDYGHWRDCGFFVEGRRC